MSDLDLTEAREMAAALYKGLVADAFGDADAAAVLTANLAPIFERQAGERIAAAIEAVPAHGPALVMRDIAARIARREQP